MGKATAAIVGALAIAGVAGGLGAAHSIFVPVKLAGTPKPVEPKEAQTVQTPTDGGGEEVDPTTNHGDETQMSPIGVAGRDKPNQTPAVDHADSAFTYIDLDQAKAIWDDFTAVFIDARPLHEYADGHIAGAYWMPASEVTGAMIFEIEKFAGGYDGQVVIYCVGGECDASENVAIRLQEAGFTNLMIMKVGFTEWAAAGYDVDEGAPPEGGG
ncbi:MAG: rhodanese-like domain-containing protein [Phycisphaerales bacterium]